MATVSTFPLPSRFCLPCPFTLEVLGVKKASVVPRTDWIPLCLSLPAWSGKAWDEHTGSPGCGSLSSWSIPSFHEPSWSTCSEWYFREETGWAPSLSASEDLLRR